MANPSDNTHTATLVLNAKDKKKNKAGIQAGHDSYYSGPTKEYIYFFTKAALIFKETFAHWYATS